MPRTVCSWRGGKKREDTLGHPTDIIVRDLRPGDRDAAIEVLTDAFVDFPPVQIVVGTDRGAKDRLRRMNQATVTESTKSRLLVAERDGDILGVLSYADPPDCFAMSWRQTLKVLRITGPRLFRMIGLYREVMKFHPKTPHRHLSQVAVEPRAQRQGVGAALMAAYCDACDEVGLPGYLETIAWADPTKPSQRKLYERYGFAVTHESPGGDGWSGLHMTRPATDPSVST